MELTIDVPVSRKRCAPSFLDHTPDYPLGKVRDWPFCPTAPSVPEGIDPEEGNIVTSHRYHNGRRGSIPHDDDVPVRQSLSLTSFRSRLD
jgi:hypothetical protein